MFKYFFCGTINNKLNNKIFFTIHQSDEVIVCKFWKDLQNIILYHFQPMLLKTNNLLFLYEFIKYYFFSNNKRYINNSRYILLFFKMLMIYFNYFLRLISIIYFNNCLFLISHFHSNCNIYYLSFQFFFIFCVIIHCSNFVFIILSFYNSLLFIYFIVKY